MHGLKKENIKKAAEMHADSILPPFGEMVRLGGFEAVYKLVMDCGGGILYVPRVKKVFGSCLEKVLLEEFNGNNMRQLAQKYGFTERHCVGLLQREKDILLSSAE